MLILGVSDIHGNVRVVRRLREQESDRFDLVVAAGDIGSAGGKGADEVMAFLATFGCPVLYVLGNHDAEISYDRDFGPACIHLHHPSSRRTAWPSSATAACLPIGASTPKSPS